MERHRLLIGLTGINVVLVALLLVQSHRVSAAVDSGTIRPARGVGRNDAHDRSHQRPRRVHARAGRRRGHPAVGGVLKASRLPLPAVLLMASLLPTAACSPLLETGGPNAVGVHLARASYDPSGPAAGPDEVGLGDASGVRVSYSRRIAGGRKLWFGPQGRGSMDRRE